MSFDINIDRTCDHKVVEDVVFIQPDYQTLIVGRDIAVANSLVVKRDGFLLDPKNTTSQYAFKVVSNSEYAASKVIRFNKRMKSNDDFYELSYITTLSDCPKCSGIGRYWDYVFDRLGEFNTLQNEAKLTQDMVKGTLTIKGSNPYFPWYGTVIDALVGGKLYNLSNIRLQVAQDVSKFVENLKNIQDQQAQLQTVTDNERIRQLLSVDVQQAVLTNPTVIQISITFSTKAGNIQRITKTFSTSPQFALLGVNQQRVS